MSQRFINNKGVSIEYYSLNSESISVPLVIVPGAIVGAGDVFESVNAFCDLKTIIISLRGRGSSSKPVSGYSLNDQISDLEAVIKHEGINEFYLFGHSVGAGIASGYTVKHPKQIKGLILGDYPPGYPNSTPEWAEYVRKNCEGVSENLLNGLVKDGVKQFFLNALAALKTKTLILKAGGADSILPIELAQKINNSLPNSELVILNNCGHEIFDSNPEEVFNELRKFMDLY